MKNDDWNNRAVGALRAAQPGAHPSLLTHYLLREVFGAWMQLERTSRADLAPWVWAQLDRILGLDQPGCEGPRWVSERGEVQVWLPPLNREVTLGLSEAEVRLLPAPGGPAFLNMTRTLLSGGLVQLRHLPALSLVTASAEDAAMREWIFRGPVQGSLRVFAQSFAPPGWSGVLSSWNQLWHLAGFNLTVAASARVPRPDVMFWAYENNEITPELLAACDPGQIRDHVFASRVSRELALTRLSGYAATLFQDWDTLWGRHELGPMTGGATIGFSSVERGVWVDFHPGVVNRMQSSGRPRRLLIPTFDLREPT
jgi:hypothetical protein